MAAEAAILIKPEADYSTRSNTVAMPWPRPIHMVAKPYFASLLSSTLISVVEMREPEQPSG